VTAPVVPASAAPTGAPRAGSPAGAPRARTTARVLLLTRDDPARSTGGVETFCRLLLRAFPRSEALAYGGAAGRRLVLNEARDAAAILQRLEAKVAQLRPAAVIANGAAAWALRGARVRRLRTPVITVYHGTYAGFGRAIAPVAWLRGLVSRTYGAFLERRAGRGRAAVVAVSAPVAAEAELFYGAAPRILENCASLDAASLPPRARARERLGLDPHARAVLFVGRAQRSKGFDLVLALARARPQLEVLAAGPEPRRPWPENLRALGVLEAEALAGAYAAADAVVHPSRYEGCPFALLDAIAADRPIVTLATGCFPRPGVHTFGIVLPEPDPFAFVACVEAVLGDRSRFSPRAAAGARFSFERFAREWRALVDEVAAADGPAEAAGGGSR
jgi:glycosyltransferase involved in cell wall biosynthesis